MTKYTAEHAAESERISEAIEHRDFHVIVLDRHGERRPMRELTIDDFEFWGAFHADRARLQHTIAGWAEHTAQALGTHGVRTSEELPPLVRAGLDIEETVIIAMIGELGPIDPGVAIVEGHLAFARPPR